MRYSRPRPVSDPARAACRLLEARTQLIKLVVAPGAVDGALAVTISNAIETLEAAAENYGAVRDREPAPPAPDVTPEEISEVKRAIREHHRQPCPCTVCVHDRMPGEL